MEKAEFEAKRKELEVLRAKKTKDLTEEKRLIDLAEKGLVFAPQEKEFHQRKLNDFIARKNKFDDLVGLADMMLSKLDQLEQNERT